MIPLQTTWKENSWKTEEALARAAVTLETERTKGSNFDVYDDDNDELRIMGFFTLWLCAFGIADGLQYALWFTTFIYTDQYVIYYAPMFTN